MTHDDNDLFRNGQLPRDPFAGAQRLALDSDEPKRDPLADALSKLIDAKAYANVYSKEVPSPSQAFVLRPAVVADALNFIHAPPKSSKSNFVFYAICAALRGEDPIPGVLELGDRPPTKALVLCEMPEAMIHGFLDLYDLDYQLRSEGKLLVASAELKQLLASPAELQRSLTAVIEDAVIDLVVIDTFTAFSCFSSGQSISESADALPMVGALQALPATVWCSHHDRKAADGSTAHVNMLGTTAIRAASSANLGICVTDEAKTLMKASLEVRDPAYLKWLAQRATATALGQPAPPPPGVSSRTWRIRLDYDESIGVRYVQAEPDVAAENEDDVPMWERGDVRAAVNTALVTLTRAAARAGAPRVFPLAAGILPAVRTAWTMRGHSERAPGRETVRAVLDELGGVLRVGQGRYPGDGRAGGYGVALYLPRPLGQGHDPEQVGGSPIDTSSAARADSESVDTTAAGPDMFAPDAGPGAGS